jgi:hypothetical protein
MRRTSSAGSDRGREYDEVWVHLRKIARERGIVLDPEDRAEERLQLKALHDELAAEVRRLLT